VIFTLVWENIRFRPLRTLLSVLLIGVPVMLILTLVGVSQGFIEDSRQRTNGVGADVIVYPAGSSFGTGSTNPMRAEMVGFLAKQPHVAQATGVVISLIGDVWLNMQGIDYPAFKRMSGGFTFVSGNEADTFRKPGDILVDTSYASDHHLHVGSAIRLLNAEWHVTAIVGTGKLTHVFADIPDLQEHTGAKGVSQIYLKLDDPKNLNPVLASLRSIMPEYRILSMQDAVSLISVDNIPAVGIFVKVIIGIGVFTGLIVVSLSMYMAVLQRTREIGILKSLGATKSFVMRLILWEAGFMGVGGTIVGIALSYASKAVLTQFVQAALPQAIVFAWWPRVLAIALGSAILGAIYPGLIAVRQDPIEALSYE
jgi:putative ABC transport system permease protein